MRLLFSYNFLAKNNTLTTDVHSVGADGQMSHLALLFSTKGAAQPSLFLWFFGCFAKCSDTFFTYIDTPRPGNETLRQVLLFAAKGTR